MTLLQLPQLPPLPAPLRRLLLPFYTAQLSMVDLL